mmetsp:Transcript_1601/g.1088  ORF Transcript_1601/g.1088 Transcript_1601/m.1088 type:complete len:122 (+) Transcript_1601:67-432(+)
MMKESSSDLNTPIKYGKRVQEQRGSDFLRSLTKEEMVAVERERTISKEREQRILSYSNSNAMFQTMSYADNDITYGLVNHKVYREQIRRSSRDFSEARQGKYVVVKSPPKHVKGKQTHYIE